MRAPSWTVFAAVVASTLSTLSVPQDFGADRGNYADPGEGHKASLKSAQQVKAKLCAYGKVFVI